MNRDNFLHIFSSFFDVLEKNRFAFLLGSLLLTIGGSEVLAHFNIDWGIRMLFTLNLLVLLSVGRRRKGFLWASILLFSMHLVLRCLTLIFDLTMLDPWEQSNIVILLLIGTLACFQTAFKNGPVDNERIFAAISLYLMIGLIFGLLFSLIDELLPRSFNHPTANAVQPEHRVGTNLIYFSFVTLATLGYGDIFPVSGPARGLAVLEAIIGQFYLALVIARLVSLYGQSDAKDTSRDNK